MKKILLLCPSSNTVRSFRMSLIRALQKEGVDVAVCAFDQENKDLIESCGVDFYCIPSENRSLNPLGFIRLYNEYKKLIKEIQPDTVFTFILKPNTFGVLAAKKVGVKNIFSMVEGAGDVFINHSFKWKVIRFVVCTLYKQAFKNTKKVFFLNNDDKKEFLQRQLVKEDQCEIIHGVGVDLDRFAFKPIKNNRTFLMIARMLKTKGVLEYCQAARIVKQKYPDAIFNYLGAEGTLKFADIQEYLDDGSVNYLGTTKDVRPYIEDSLAVVLPSYREGMPMVIMETEAIGRGVVVSNSVGCKDTVNDGYNGWLVEVGNVEQIAEKAIWFIEHPEKAIEMGKNSRQFAEEHFDQKKINEKIIEIIQENCIEKN